MDLSLPDNVRVKLDQTLGQWRHWHCEPPLSGPPEVLRTLGPGLSNYSVLVAAHRPCVVRIDGVNPATNGLNRQWEWRALQSAHAAGLAPCPRYFNPDLGSLVTDYLPHDDDSTSPGEVATLLRAIHGLPPRHHRLDLGERILRYEKHLEHQGSPVDGGLRECRPAVLDILSELQAEPGQRVLCHNDLLAANRVRSAGRLWAIDWEYCAMGSPWYELAVVTHGDNLAAEDCEELLDTYLQRSPDNSERRRLARYGCVYRYLELLWFLALDRAALTVEERACREDALAKLLRA
jgi:hypothetical protein